MKIRYGVYCAIHGTSSKNWDGKMVIVPQPHTKKQIKHGGCPFVK